MKIVGTKEEIDKLVENSNYNFSSVIFKVLEMGRISDEEIDAYGKFTDSEKRIIRNQYASHQEGYFKNPLHALKIKGNEYRHL